MKVAVYVNHLEQEYQLAFYKAFQSRAAQLSLDTVCIQQERLDEFNPEEGLCPSSAFLSVDGAVFLSSSLMDTSANPLTEELKSRFPGIPLLSAGTSLPGIKSVMIRTKESMQQLMSHLLDDHGYKKIVYVGGHEWHKDNILRKAVFRKAIEDAGRNDPEVSRVYLKAAFTEYSGMQALEGYIKENPADVPDVIVCANDTTALGVQKVLRVQEDPRWQSCAVTGFDDIAEAGEDGVSLTTIRQPLSLLGVFAAEAIYKLMAKEHVEDVMKISSSFVIRQSCGCPPVVSRRWEPSPQGKLESFISKIQHNQIRTELLERYVSHFGQSLIQADSIVAVVEQVKSFLAAVEIQDFYMLIFDAVDRLPDNAFLTYQKEAGVESFFGMENELVLKEFFASPRFSSQGNSGRSVVYYFMSGQERLGMMVYRDDPLIHAQMCNCGIFIAGALNRIRTLEKEKSLNQLLEAEVQKRTRELVQTNEELVKEAKKRIAVEAQVLKIGELERKRFSMDLHDDICQRLAGISMMCAGMASQNEKLAELSSLIDETLRRTRQYAHDSFPMELNALGLEKAIEKLCDTAQRQSYGNTKVSYSWKLKGGLDQGDDRNRNEINLYRIIQEALNNSLRHAKASHIDVSAFEEDGEAKLVIRDDGIGNPDIDYPSSRKVAVKTGVGLQSMRYRVDQLGAVLKISSSKEAGTSVVVSWKKSGNDTRSVPDGPSRGCPPSEELGQGPGLVSGGCHPPS
ncbi:MAG: substrate-binding domain-containing protein [Treponema sp.]|nr:substrate-binding domain-containing protein [Treponema sp.]